MGIPPARRSEPGPISRSQPKRKKKIEVTAYEGGRVIGRKVEVIGSKVVASEVLVDRVIDEQTLGVALALATAETSSIVLLAALDLLID